MRRRALPALLVLSSAAGLLVPLLGRHAAATTVVFRSEGRGVRVGDLAFFTACRRRDGCELWKTDGTPEGTGVVRDIFAGGEGSDPVGLTPVGRSLYFLATDAEHCCQLWVTDGTAAGTKIVKDTTGTLGRPFSLMPVGGRLYFVAEDAEHGAELWTTNGTEVGTVLVKDLLPGPASSRPRDLTPVGERLFFLAGQGDQALYVTDGTAAGTLLLTGPSMTWIQLHSYAAAAFKGELFFVGRDEQHGQELWKSDGTPEGTVVLSEVAPGPASADFRRPIPFGSQLLFEAWSPASGSEPWTTDGTRSGTQMLADVDPGPASSMSRPPYGTEFTPGKGPRAAVAFFVANVSATGEELWKTDGTPAGTRRVGTIPPVKPPSAMRELRAAGGLVYFVAEDAAHGRELWRSDGTASGTRLLRDVNPGPASSDPRDLVVEEDLLYFVAFDGRGDGLWKADGVKVSRMAQIQDGRLNQPTYVTALPNAVLFCANDQRGVRRLWAARGNSARAVPLTDDLFGSGPP